MLSELAGVWRFEELVIGVEKKPQWFPKDALTSIWDIDLGRDNNRCTWSPNL